MNQWYSAAVLALCLAVAPVGARAVDAPAGSPANAVAGSSAEAEEALAADEQEQVEGTQADGDQQVAQATSPAAAPSSSAQTSPEGEEEGEGKGDKKGTQGAAASVAKKKEEAKASTPNAAVQNALGAIGGGTGLPFGAIISLSNSVGYGSFVSDPYVRRPQYDIAVSLNPYADIAAGHRISAFIAINKNVFSNYDGSSNDIVTLTREGQTTVSDLIVQYTALNVLSDPTTGLRLNLGAGVVLPTSKASQVTSLYLGTRVQATLIGMWDWFFAAYTLRVTKNFNEYTHPKVENSGSIPICLQRDSGDSSACFPGGFANIEWSIRNSIFLSFTLSDALSANVSWAMINSFSYDVSPDDALTAIHADSGRGQRDAMLAALGLNYQINQYFSASINATSFQAPFSPDNKTLRFPFFSTNPNNVTVFDLTLTGTF